MYCVNEQRYHCQLSPLIYYLYYRFGHVWGLTKYRASIITALLTIGTIIILMC